MVYMAALKAAMFVSGPPDAWTPERDFDEGAPDCAAAPGSLEFCVAETYVGLKRILSNMGRRWRRQWLGRRLRKWPSGKQAAPRKDAVRPRPFWREAPKRDGGRSARRGS